MKLTCTKCQGNKTYRGVGYVNVKCEPCKGTGQIEIEVKEKKKVEKATKKEEVNDI